MTEHSEDFGQMGQTCDECSPCWPHRGGYGFCPCDCHPADPAADLEHAMAVIEHLQGENERLRKALELACEDGWDDGQWAMRRYLEMAQASLSGSPVEGTR